MRVEENVWANIRANEGQVFRQVRGREFTYEVRGNSIIPSTTNRILSRSQFGKALGRMPLTGPGQIQDLQGPSYIFAILTDKRIALGSLRRED